MLVNDRKEIGTLGYRLSSNLFGCRLNSSVMVGTVPASVNLSISLREQDGFQSSSDALDTHVYVINKNGKPLMPCNPTKAKHLLKAEKAKVIKKTPFTIKLLWDAGMDTGSKTIGCAAITNGKAVYQSEVQVRQDVSKKQT